MNCKIIPDSCSRHTYGYRCTTVGQNPAHHDRDPQRAVESEISSFLLPQVDERFGIPSCTTQNEYNF